MSKIITEERAEKLENLEYLNDILEYLDEIQKENNYTDDEMDSDLDVALWRAYVYNNMDSYDYYDLAEKTLAKVKDEGIKSGVWCYRYSCALVYLRRFDEALKYSRLGTEVEPSYPWGWLQLGRLCYKYNLLDEAFHAIDKGLELVPGDYEFLTLKDDIENDRGYAYANSHYINEEADKNLKERLIDVDDEELYNSFINKTDLERELDMLHKRDKHEKIIEIINSLPEEELNYDILGKLARAYNNNGECEKGLEVLMKMKDEGENTALWNFRVGYSYYYSNPSDISEKFKNLEEAKKYFERCLELNPEEPDADTLLRYTYSDLGNKKLEEGEREEGIEYLKKARELAKGEDEIIYSESELAWAYDYLGEHEKSYEYLQNVISLGRDDSWIHSELGFCLKGLEKFDEALKEFEKAVELGRDDIWINSELGWLYNQNQNFEKALTHLRKAEEDGREDWWLSFEIGYSLTRLLEVQEGIKYYKKAIEQGKDDIPVNSELGYWLDSIREYKEALPYLEKVKKLGRDDEWINTEIGFCLNRLERYEEGLSYLEKSLELGRNDEWIFSETAFCLKKLKRYEEALEYYKKSEETGRNDEWINSEISECLGELGKTEEAIAKLKNFAATKDGNTDTVNSQIGYLYGRLNNSEEALKYLYEAEKLGRKDVWLCSEIGWNLSENPEKYEEALGYFNKAVELGRDDTWINGQIGFVLSKMGKNKEAIKYFEKAKFINSEDTWILYHLGSCYRKTGDIEKALNVLNISLEKGEYKGWVELELAWCYALIDEKEKAEEYLKEADSYIGGEIVSSFELKKDFETIKKLISSTSYLA